MVKLKKHDWVYIQTKKGREIVALVTMTNYRLSVQKVWIWYYDDQYGAMQQKYIDVNDFDAMGIKVEKIHKSIARLMRPHQWIDKEKE